ncbi:MAG: sulfotransferase [Pontiellaceae bacterium]|nr:sulfotransferase [Pontiellaceae bacterium]MBN2783985.1 sulfotransferase [Pontiellaceae bacterium]
MAKADSVVSAEIRFLSNLVFGMKRFWAVMAGVESSFLRDSMDELPIEQPIYITGLARSGTTILLEMLAEHVDTESHVYKDFPMLYTPYWWERYLKLAGRGAGAGSHLEERTHNDGIKVGPGSPEAMEEPLWMHFFDHLHDPAQCNLLDASSSNPAFEAFYADHIRKFLLTRSGRRYLAKGNYNLARIGYLLKLFPDARFVIPVRDPVAHIASLQKQQILFEQLEQDDVHVLRHMCRVGHYEFGLNWTPVNYGRAPVMNAIRTAWDSGSRIEAWALYWNDTHRYLLDLLKNPAAAKSIKVVSYEKLCNESESVIPGILQHCGLEMDSGLIDRYAARLAMPTYYSHGFSEDEVNLIQEQTDETYRQLMCHA